MGIGLAIRFIGFSNTARDYTYKSLLHSDQCSQSRCLVTAPMADVPLLPGSRPFRLATTLTLMASLAITKLSSRALLNCQTASSEIYCLGTDRREDTFSERIPRKHPLVIIPGNLPCCLRREPQRARHSIVTQQLKAGIVE
jgi:hypothetical protein